MAKKTSIFLTLVVIVIGATVALLVWNWDALVERISKKAVDAERQAWVERTQELEGIIRQMEKGEETKPLLPTERLREVFGPASPLVRGVSPKRITCRELEQSLRAFCDYLDATETLRSQKTSQQSWALLSDLLGMLERRLPNISGESHRPELVIQNSFYFFRLLRRAKVDLVRNVFKYEADLAEPLMGILYYWLVSGQQCDKPPSVPANLKVMYHYAGFFLNTLGGHSYLYRRDSRIRLLTIYYSILVIHEADLRGLNEAGLDLRFILPLLFSEIQSRNDLLYAEEYLQTLSKLQLHYFQRE